MRLQLLILMTFAILSKGKKRRYRNWTSCKDFGHDAYFDPKEVVGIDWVPFFTWSQDNAHETMSFIHRFSYLDFKMVRSVKYLLDTYVTKELDWKRPKLCFSSDLVMLLIAADKKGKYRSIPIARLPHFMKLSKMEMPIINLRLKMVGPYLAMMFCNHQYATIMAISGNVPADPDEMRAEADMLKFQGIGYPVTRESVKTSKQLCQF